MTKPNTPDFKGLKAQFDLLQDTLNLVGAHIFIKDLQGRYTFVNQHVCDLFGLPAEDIIGKDDSHFFAIDSSSDIRRNDKEVLEKGVAIESEERNFIARTGEVRYYVTVKKPSFDENGNIIGLIGVSTDITERKIMELKLKQSNDLLDTILTNIDAFVYMKDRDSRFLYVNQKTADLFHMSEQEILGKTNQQLMSEEQAKDFQALDDLLFTTGKRQQGEEIFIGPNGQNMRYWSTKIPLTDENGNVDRYIGFSTDITELAYLRDTLEKQVLSEIEKRLKQEHLATTDPLTGLFNRLKLNETLEYEIQRAVRFKEPLSIIFIDFDHFKQINDEFGHQVGDKVLEQMATLIESLLREVDVLGRWGGEELLIICPETTKDGAIHLAEKLRTTIEKASFDTQRQQTASLGISTFKSNDTPASLFERADQAMYQAKRQGRNQVVFLDN